MRDSHKHQVANAGQCSWDNPLYKVFFEENRDAVWLHDITTGKFVDANDAAQSLLGYEVESLRQMSPRDMASECHKSYSDELKKKLELEGRIQFNTIMVPHNGVPVHLNIDAWLIEDTEQQLSLTVARDISAEHEAEVLQEALYKIAERSSYIEDIQDFYRAMHRIVGNFMYSENFYIALYSHEDEMLRFPYFVDEFESALAERNKARGLTEYVIHSEEPLLATMDDIRQMASEGKIKLIGEIAVDWLGVPLKRGNNLFGVLAVQSYDHQKRYTKKDLEILTYVAQHIGHALERKQNLDRLARERQRLKITLSSIADAFISTDVLGRVSMMNQVAEKLTGMTQDEAIGKRLAEFCPLVLNEASTEIGDPIQTVVSSGRPIDAALGQLIPIADRKPVHVSFSVAPVSDENTVTIGAVLVIRDITDQHKLEQEVQKAVRLESIGVLAGGIAHDFNNILTAVIGNLSLAQADASGDSTLYRRLEEVNKAAYRAKSLTKQLLTFSKGGVHMRKVGDVRQLVRDSAELALLGSSVSCKYVFPQSLWPVEADMGQIGQVINNIVLNAVQAMPDGGVIKIRVRNLLLQKKSLKYGVALKKGDYLHISIKDQGTGIAPEHLSHIFDPYFSTRQMGSGLGLATTYSIVQRHSGAIAVSSELDKGSSFHVFLPALREAPEIQERELTAPVQGSGRVLTMDDEEQIRSLIGQMLQSLGYDHVEVANGDLAVESYEKALENGEPFDAVILGLTIPGGKGGKETVKRLHEIDPKVRAIVSSGYSNDRIMENYREHGFCACVPKPFNLKEISNVLHQVLVGA